MHSWSAKGYGYALESDKRTLYNFLKKRNMLDKIDFDEEALESEFFCPEYDFGFDHSLAWEIADQINEETGLSLFRGFESIDDTPMHIGWEPCYSWLLTEKERALTQEDITKILKRYGEELGISAEPDFFEIEYYG